MSNREPVPPEKEYRISTITAAIWREEVPGRDDRPVTQLSVRVKKEFFDKSSGKYRETTVFFADDLPRLATVAMKAFEYVSLKTREPSSQRGEAQSHEQSGSEEYGNGEADAVEREVR